MTTIATIWKKIVSAVFWLISGGLVVLIAALHFVTPQGRGTHTPRAIERAGKKAARPRPADEDAKTVLWLARLHDRPARVMAVPFMLTRARAEAIQAVFGRPTVPVNVVRAQLGLPELKGLPVPPPGVPAADVDQYLTEHAEQYRHGFDREFPVLGGELAPLPWIGPQVGDIILDAPMTYRPEPPLEPLPPGRACPDTPVNVADLEQWRSPRQHYATGLCWCGRCHDQSPQDVPGPAESAAPQRACAEAAIPRAVTSAGPGTPPCVDNLNDTGWLRALTAWALYAPLDQVKAAGR